MITTTNRALEFEALIAESQAIAAEVLGMKFENEQRIHLYQSMAYVEDSFCIEAAKLRVIADKLRVLKKGRF
jgi:hypothetical protein